MPRMTEEVSASAAAGTIRSRVRIPSIQRFTIDRLLSSCVPELPSARPRPSHRRCRTILRWSWMLWLASRIVRPPFANDLNNSRISATPCLSSPFSGSSRIIKLGSSMIACAMPRRCRMPREYLPTGLDIMGSSPTRRIVSATCFSPDLAFQPSEDFQIL